MRRRTGQVAGFTLVELLIAVGLLAMIIVIIGFVFDTAMGTISSAQGNAELHASLAAYAERIRDDLKGIERDGYLVFGRRDQEAYATMLDRGNTFRQEFRNDWLEFFSVSEKHSTLDPRAMGILSRILIGHGRVTQKKLPNGSNNSLYSNVATDWTLMRHQFLSVAIEVIDSDDVQVAGRWQKAWTTMQGIDYASAQTQSQDGILPFRQMVEWYSRRSPGQPSPQSDMERVGGFQWFWHKGIAQNNSFKGLEFIHEPDYYFAEEWLYANDARRFWLLPHCASFRVQYAMAEDCDNGTVVWHDPPEKNEPGYEDPNYDSNDDLHATRNIINGRLVFGPGDEWPRLLKVTAMAFDPLNRLKTGRQAELIIALP